MLQPDSVFASRYRIKERLGTGATATVYRANDIRLEREVAVKVLHGSVLGDAAITQRFEREARVLAAVRHPAIVAIYDVDPGEEEHEPFLVMELCPRGSLADRLESAGTLEPNEVLLIARRIATALAALHQRGILHRDVKPQNILLSDEGPKLADFGIAKDAAVGALASLTSAGTALGTVAYSAPETLQGDVATPATDTYGLAAVVYEALTGRQVRRTDNLAAAIEGRHDTPPPPSAVRPSLGTSFDASLSLALSPHPSLRPTLEEFIASLEAARADRSSPATPDADTVMAPVPAVAASSPSVHDRPTRAMTTEPPAPSPSVRPARYADRGGNRWVGMAGVALVALALLAVVALVLAMLGDQRGGAGPQASAFVGASAAPGSLAAAPAQTSETGSSPPERPGSDGVSAAIANLRAVAGNLEDDVQEDVIDRTSSVEKSLDEDGLEKAAEKARELSLRVDELIREDKVTGDAARRLEAAARALVDALSR